MSTASKIGSVFGSLGSGVATVGGPIGMGIGAGFSVLGGLIGLGGQIKEKKEREEEQAQALREAQRDAVAEAGQVQAQDAAQDVQRAQQANTGAQPVVTSSRSVAPIQPAESVGYPEAQEGGVLGPELRDMFAGVQPGRDNFYG